MRLALYSKEWRSGANMLFILFLCHQTLNDKLLRCATQFVTERDYQLTGWKVQVYVLLIFFL
jgi:hypothetical protein